MWTVRKEDLEVFTTTNISLSYRQLLTSWLYFGEFLFGVTCGLVRRARPSRKLSPGPAISAG